MGRRLLKCGNCKGADVRILEQVRAEPKVLCRDCGQSDHEQVALDIADKAFKVWLRSQEDSRWYFVDDDSAP